MIENRIHLEDRGHERMEACKKVHEKRALSGTEPGGVLFHGLFSPFLR